MLDLEKDHLPDARVGYSKVGTEAKRQIDLLVKIKGRTSSTADQEHGWSDILIVAELKKSEGQSKALLMQVASIIRSVSANQPTRRFVQAVILTGTFLESWVFDRSGAYSAELFNIQDEPKKFIQVVLATC